MKKILFVVAAMVTLSFASCGNKVEPSNGNASDTDTVAVDTVDTIVVDSVK